MFIGLLTSQSVKSQTGSSFDNPITILQGETSGKISPGESIFYTFSTNTNFEYLFSLTSSDSDTDFDLFLHDANDGEYLGRSNGLIYPEQISLISIEAVSIVIQVFSLNSDGEFTLTISLTLEATEDNLRSFNLIHLSLPFILAFVYRKKNR